MSAPSVQSSSSRLTKAGSDLDRLASVGGPRGGADDHLLNCVRGIGLSSSNNTVPTPASCAAVCNA